MVPATHGFCGSCGARMDKETGGPKAVPKGSADPSDPHEPEAGTETQVRLVLINPDGSTGDTIPLRSGDNVFGREQGSPVFQDDPFLSPQHVCFSLKSGVLEVRDLNSLNGIFYRILEPTELQHGDSIRIGRQLIRFEILDQATPIVEARDSTDILGAPRTEAWGRLVRISNPGVSSEAFLLKGSEEVIGRERGGMVFRDDGFVSARHTRITADAGRYFLEDLRSSNGTFIRIRGSRHVKHGDLLLLGQQPMRAFLGAS